MSEGNFKTILIECQPSEIDGVGVFAVRLITKGQIIAEGINAKDYEKLVPWEKIKSVELDIKKKIKDFCIGTPEGFIPPEDFDFNKMTVEWYFNHSCSGNVGFNENGDFVTIRNIKVGEELTYDYGLAESNPEFSMQCNCGSTNCRHLITGNDWKYPEFRETNLNHMLPKLRKAYKIA
jgi:SET domain-containing protein